MHHHHRHSFQNHRHQTHPMDQVEVKQLHPNLHEHHQLLVSPVKEEERRKEGRELFLEN